MTQSELELLLAQYIEDSDIPAPQREARFHPKRRWRFDFSWPYHMIACEAEGGTWVGGRHVTGAGFEKDCEKYNAAALLDWKVFRFTTGQISSGYAIETLLEAFKEFI